MASALPRFTTADLLRHLRQLLRGHVGACAALTIPLLLQALAMVLTPVCYKLLFDRVIPQRDGRQLAQLTLALAVLLGTMGAAERLAALLLTRLAARVSSELRERMFQHLLRVPVNFFSGARAGDVIARFGGDLSAVERLIRTSIYKTLWSGLIALLCIGGLLILEPRLGVVTLVVTPIPALFMRRLSARATAASYELRNDAGRVTSALQDALLGHRDVRAFSLQPALQTRFRLLSQILAQSSRRAGLLDARAEQLSSAGLFIGQLLIMGMGGYLVVRGDMTGGALAGFIALLRNLAISISVLGAQFPDVLQATSGMQRIAELLDEPVTPGSDAAPAAPLRLARELRLTNVGFRYEDRSSATLEGISLTIRAGQSVALVGRSGSGKSTVLNLLLRFTQPSEGVITVDDRDLSSVAPEAWLRGVGSVVQSTYLFPMSVRDNIRQGRLDATDAEVEAAARAAEIHDAILALPGGYDTFLGEHGGRLSVGQQQRLSLARAIVRDPALLLLDEATSALDPATEAAIEATLERLSAGRTRITVTHRLASAAKADRIFVLERGRLIEQGSHEELLARQGTYFQLWQRQSSLIVESGGTQARLQTLFLRTIPLFSGLSDEQLAPIAAGFVSESHDAGTTLIEEGEQGDKLYIVVRGRVSVQKQSKGAPESGRAVVLQDGDLFGEIALLSGTPRSATVRTVEKTLLLTLSRSQFNQCLDRVPGLRADFEKVARARASASAEDAPDRAQD